jgi:DNA-binding IclR family transcriptional regulator
MTTTDHRARACEILKALRAGPLTVSNLSTVVGMPEKTLRGWLNAFERNGFVEVDGFGRRPGLHGKWPYRYRLTKAWGGV